MLVIPMKLFREIRNIDEGEKKDDLNQERIFGRVAKIPISHAYSELVEMDCVD